MTRISEICKSVYQKQITPEGNFFRYPNPPKVPDYKVVALAIAASMEEYHSENHLFFSIEQDKNKLFGQLPCRQSYNRRVKKLREFIDGIASHITDELFQPNDTIVVDSTMMPTCKFSRAYGIKICKEDRTNLPSYGYCASQKTKYYGYKLHLACSDKGVVLNYFISDAKTADINCVKDLLDSLPDGYTVIGDKGYISKAVQLDLFETKKMRLITPLRCNQRAPSFWNNKHSANRQRIETLFGQLISQFGLRSNLIKTTRGLFARLSTQIAAYTVAQYFNFLEGLPLSQIKNSTAFQ